MHEPTSHNARPTLVARGLTKVYRAGEVEVRALDGADFTLYSKPSILDGLYGDGPVSWQMFVRLRPAKMEMSQHNTRAGASHP